MVWVMGVVAVLRLADHLESRLVHQHCCGRRADHGMIVGNDDRMVGGQGLPGKCFLRIADSLRLLQSLTAPRTTQLGNACSDA